VTRRCSAVLVVLFFTLGVWADSASAPDAKHRPMSQQTRFYVIRGLQSEIAFARKPFPMGTKGLTLNEDGTVTPSDNEIAKELAVLGPAVRPGDRVNITLVKIAKDYILFELNGGPKKKKKWYDHIDVGMPGAPTVKKTEDQPPENPRGTLLILSFKGFVPEISPDALKEMLHPVLDFSSKSAAEAYLDTIPPKAKEAIKNHQVLVGMDQDMVIYAKGRPGKKIRENDEHGKPYEEWIYGTPPEDVEFVRFSGPEVVQVKTMKVGGEKIVRTEKEVDLKEVREAKARKKEEEQAAKPKAAANRPTLKRPGEEDDPAVPKRSSAPSAPSPVDPNQQDPTLGPPRGQQQPAPMPLPPPQGPGQGDPTSPGR
jgi:hypothetical protein